MKIFWNGHGDHNIRCLTAVCYQFMILCSTGDLQPWHYHEVCCTFTVGHIIIGLFPVGAFDQVCILNADLTDQRIQKQRISCHPPHHMGSVFLNTVLVFCFLISVKSKITSLFCIFHYRILAFHQGIYIPIRKWTACVSISVGNDTICRAILSASPGCGKQDGIPLPIIIISLIGWTICGPSSYIISGTVGSASLGKILCHLHPASDIQFSACTDTAVPHLVQKCHTSAVRIPFGCKVILQIIQ